MVAKINLQQPRNVHMKADLELVAYVAKQQLDAEAAQRLVNEIQERLAAEKDDEDKTPPIKKQWCILLSDPTGRLTAEFFAASGFDAFTGWVLQIPEDDHPSKLVEYIAAAAYDFNASPKGRRMPVQSIGEALECVPARFFKEQQVWVKSKEPVWVQITDNVIPSDNSELASELANDLFDRVNRVIDIEGVEVRIGNATASKEGK